MEALGRHDPERSERLSAIGTEELQHAALGGEAIFSPDALDMDERGLAKAVDGVLQGGDWDGIVRICWECHGITAR